MDDYDNETFEEQDLETTEETTNEEVQENPPPLNEPSPISMVSSGATKAIANSKALKILKLKIAVSAGIALLILIIISVLLGNEANDIRYDYLTPKCENITVQFEHASKETQTYPLEEYVANMVYSQTKELPNPDRVLYQALAVNTRTEAQNLENCTLTVNDEVDAYYEFLPLEKTNKKYTEITEAVSYVKGLIMADNTQVIDATFDAFCYETKGTNETTIKNIYSGPNIPTSWVEREITNSYFKNCPCKVEREKSSTKQDRCFVESLYSEEEEYYYVDGGDGKGLSVYTAYYLSAARGYHDEEILRFFYQSEWEYHTIDLENAKDEDENDGGLGTIGCMWWPIGSMETTEENGIQFASGPPASTRITSYFGNRARPTPGASTNHPAIDIGGPSAGYSEGIINIIAASSGTIKKVTIGCRAGNRYCGGGLGNSVTILHSDGTETRYGHLYSVNVSLNEKVSQGQVIGKMGNTGASSGTHLDFQVKVNGTPVNPLNYVSTTNTRPDCSAPSTPGKDISIGSDNAQSVCLTFKKNGFTDNGIAGVMGNFEQESHFSPTVVNYIGCSGIAQWCNTKNSRRLATLKSIYGDAWSTIEAQLEFVLHELNTGYVSTKNYLRATHTEEEMAYYFCMNYEIPGKAQCSNGVRQNYAKKWLPYVKRNCQ